MDGWRGMMEPRSWLEKGATELEALVREPALDANSVLRALALYARLESSPDGPRPSQAAGSRIKALRQVAPEVEPAGILDALARELASEDEPHGALHDVLLDVDDAAGILGIVGRAADREELLARSAALVASWPDRVLPLASFAELRCSTLDEGSPVRELWDAVRSAPALLLAEALPPVEEVQVPLPLELLRAARTTFQVPRQITARVAADDGKGGRWRFEADDRLHGAVIVEKAGLLTLEAQFPEGVTKQGKLWLEVEKLTSGEILECELIPHRASGCWLYADLGAAVGERSLLRSIIRRCRLPEDEVGLRLRFEEE